MIENFLKEYQAYRRLGLKAIAQVSDDALNQVLGADNNSIAVIVRHISGNLRSRFTDFLTTDGEKPWRKREEEFDDRRVTRAELLAKWERGWAVVLSALDALSDADLGATVTIRQQPLLVHQALHRSLAHVAYHVGQIVYVAKGMRGDAWKSLSIPRGMSDTFKPK